MATAALIALGGVSLLVFLLFRAVVELFRDVRQIRDALGILDRPLDIEVGAAAGKAPSDFGLPRKLDEQRAALVLFLSERCATCRVIAGTLSGALPAGLWIVVEAGGPEAAREFIETFGLKSGLADKRVVVDVGNVIADRLGLSTTPAAYRIESGAIMGATTIPSVRSLVSALPAPSGEPVPNPARRMMPALFPILSGVQSDRQ